MELGPENFRVWLLSQIDQIFEKNGILQKIICFSHALWILIFLLNWGILKSCEERQVCSTLIAVINNWILTKIVRFETFLSLLASIATIGLTLMIGKFAQVRINFNAHNNRFLGLLVNLTTLNYTFIQIAIFPALYYAFHTSYLNTPQQIVVFLAIVFCYYVLNSLLPKNSLYQQSTFLILMLVMTMPSSWIAHLIIALVTIYYLITSLEKLQRILLKIILLVSLKTVWLDKSAENFQLISVSAGIYYGIIFLIIFIYVIFFGYQFKLISDKNTFYSIFIKTKTIQPNTIIQQSLTLKQILSIFTFFQTQTKKCRPQLLEKLEYQLNAHMTIEQFHQIHLTLLQYVNKKHQLPLYGILILKLKIITQKNILDILTFRYSTKFSTEGMSWKEKIMLYETQQKLINNYGEFNIKKQLKVTQMLKIYAKIQDFKTHFYDLIKLQIKFWKKILRSKIYQEDLFEDFSKIEQKRLKLKEKDHLLLKSRIFDNIQLLFERQQFTIFQYQSFYQDQSSMKWKKSMRKSEDKLTLQTVEEIELLQQVSQNSFLIISDNRVSFLSTSLAKQLKKNLKIGYEMSEIFGPYFSDFLTQKIGAISNKGKNQWIPLPLFIDKFHFVLSNARIFWLPSTDNKATFFVKISLMQSEPYIIYNTGKNLISFYNLNFIHQFDLSDRFVKIEIQRQQLRFQRLFLSSFKEYFPYLELNTAQNHISYQPQNYIGQRDKININGLAQGDIQLTPQSIPIIVQVWSWIDVNEGKLVIMSVRKIVKLVTKTSSKTSSHTFEIERTLTRMNNETRQSHDQHNYANEINQAFSMIKQGKISKRIAIPIAIILVLIGVLVTGNVLDRNLFNNRMTKYNSKIDEISLGSDCFILLYRMYKRASKNYQYLVYPENVQQNLGVSLQSVIQSVKDSERGFLNTFVSQYLQSMQFKPKSMSYKLIFQQFNITTSTDYSTLMDFAEHFLRNIELNEYDFILENYLSMRQLATNFQQVSDILAQINKLAWTTHLQSLIFIAVIICLHLILFFVELSNRLNIKNLLKIYCLLSNKQVEKKIAQLQSYIEDNWRMDGKYGDGEEGDEVLPLLGEQGERNEEEVSDRPADRDFHQPSESSHIHATPTPKKHSKPFKLSSFRKLTKYFTYVFISLLFLSIPTLQYLTSSHQMTLATAIINYQSLIDKTLIEMNRINTDTGLAPVFRHRYGNELNLTQHVVSMNDRLEMKNQLKEIDEINGKMMELMEGDMCKFAFTDGVEMMKCEDFAGGLMTKGYSESYNYMVQLSKHVQSLNLSKFNTEKCTPTFCPPYFLFDEISLRINSLFKVILSVFTSMQVNYFTQLQIYYNFIFWIKNSISALAIFIIIIEVYREVKRSKMAVRLFIYIPTKIINSKRVTNYLKKNNTINDLEEF